MKSVVFQLGTWTVGGVERVTVVLANAFVRQGWRVAVSAYRFEDRMLIKELLPDVAVIELDGGLTEANCAKLHNVLVEREVTAVINQWCVNFKHTRFLRKAMAGTGAKLIAVHHNRPDVNNRIMNAHNPLLKWLWRRITAWSLQKVYAASDRYVLLSPSFVELFKSFTGLCDGEKLAVVPNPVTLSPDRSVNGDNKENVLLYVGRLEETQKRVSRILVVWRELAGDFSDWQLKIVGDGPDRSRYEAMAADLPRVHFAGMQPPVPYYSRAKILLLTSDFEGFPLVLCEAMAFGCVPVVLRSFAAAADVVDDSVNGYLFPEPFSSNAFALKLRRLMGDELLRLQVAKAAVARARSFSLEVVMEKWGEVLCACGS